MFVVMTVLINRHLIKHFIRDKIKKREEKAYQRINFGILEKS